MIHHLLLSPKYLRAGMVSAFILSLMLQPALASTPDRPDAGKTLNSLQDSKLQEKKTVPNVKVEQEKQATIDSNEMRFKVNGFHFTGQNLYSEDNLLSLVKDAVGKELSLSELQVTVNQISKYLHNEGYLVAKAYIPAQDIRDGVVNISIVVGQYGKIDIRNHSRLDQNAMTNYLSRLKSGDYIRNDILERALLLLNDTSGISAKASLVPGSVAGTSDLIVEVNDTKKTNGQVYVDNYGNRFTGKNRLGLSVDVTNISGIGDAFNFGGIYTGSSMNDYNILYRLPTGGQGANFGVGYSRMHYSLGEDFASLNANGIATTTSFYETYAFIRSRNFNLNGRIGYDHKQLQDRIDTSGVDNRKKIGVWSIGLSGDSHDNFGGGGATSFALTYSRGHLDMESADAQASDVQAQTAGTYSKTNLDLYRMQMINNRLNFYLSFSGQLANKNLDSSEKLSLGGANGVRAYPQGEASGDEGYLLTGEFRWNLPTPNFQLATFIDNGKVTLNKNPWDASRSSRSLTGAGLGLIWNRPGDYSIRCDYAWKITSDPATSDSDKNGRFWLRGVKYF